MCENENETQNENERRIKERKKTNSRRYNKDEDDGNIHRWHEKNATI